MKDTFVVREKRGPLWGACGAPVGSVEAALGNCKIIRPVIVVRNTQCCHGDVHQVTRFSFYGSQSIDQSEIELL